MVALSLYKGNLHTVTGVPHRLLRPTPKISPKHFKILLHRRARALSRIRFSTADEATTSNPNPSPDSNPECTGFDPSCTVKAVNGSDTGGNRVDNPCSERELMVVRGLKEEDGEKGGMREEGKGKDEKLVEGEDYLRKLAEEDKNDEDDKNDEKAEAPLNPEVEKTESENARIDVEKRKKEVEEKMEILNEKKHSLLQVLKQILSAEEQLKRQNRMQGVSGRPPLPLQVDIATDSGSMTRVNTPRMGSNENPCGDLERGEADDISNHNVHSRQLPRMSSTSPSSYSRQRKPASNMVPHSYRTTIGVAGSPSQFAPAGQGPQSVSGAGASHKASSPSPSPSPSPSASGSISRDGRLPSPWN